jgi:hypothetical protein
VAALTDSLVRVRFGGMEVDSGRGGGFDKVSLPGVDTRRRVVLG